MNPKTLLPLDQRKIKIHVADDGELTLAVSFRSPNAWRPIPFSDFSQTLTKMADLEAIIQSDMVTFAPAGRGMV